LGKISFVKGGGLGYRSENMNLLIDAWGENPLKCITHDKMDLVFIVVLSPYILIPNKINE
jgi:hypothetical protein